VPGLAEHFFRHAYGRLVAVLIRKVGARHLDAVEDAVQAALLAALDAWTTQGHPHDPSAWLYRVAHNRLMGELRMKSERLRILEKSGFFKLEAGETPTSAFYESEVRDDLLRMIFICCDKCIPRDSRLVLALKTLCGFSAAEIAHRLFTSEANVHKRLERARNRLRESPLDSGTPTLESLAPRLPSVLATLYLLFNEGYLSLQADSAIRSELCDEAVRLATSLAGHSVGAVPETFALLALMHFHAARLAARQDASGGLLLLEEQDRGLWDREQIRVGSEWLGRSAQGEIFSRYHAEAGIAAAHCLSPSFQETPWMEIADLYALLERISPSPLHTLNRAVAIAEQKGPEAGLALLNGMEPPSWLEASYLWEAVLSDLNRRAGRIEVAMYHRERALLHAPSNSVRETLMRRLGDGPQP
jgi:RNA polymerase sigma factor (sigma-70 family)